MIETTSQKFFVVLGTLAVLGILGYFLFNSTDIPTTPADLSGQEVLGQDILTLAEKVNTISIDQSVFTSSVFLSLVDHEIPLFPEPQGRPNPFAVIGADVGTVGTTSSR